MMDYLWDKFGDFSFSHFGQTHRITDRITEVDDCYTTVGVSNNNTQLKVLHPRKTFVSQYQK